MILKQPFRQKLSYKLKKNGFEYAAWKNSLTVCGIDEVGRGCLAGPLVTAAVILPPHTTYRLLKDSKTLTEEERATAYHWIFNNALFGIGIIHHRLIDRHNIWQATLLGMKRACLQLITHTRHHPTAIITDAMPLQLADTAFAHIPVHYFPKADSLSISVAAASIVAKVTRDNLMKALCPLFPGYHFAQHKAYATALHREALMKFHKTIIHRNSFLKKMESDLHQQRSFIIDHPICISHNQEQITID